MVSLSVNPKFWVRRILSWVKFSVPNFGYFSKCLRYTYFVELIFRNILFVFKIKMIVSVHVC